MDVVIKTFTGVFFLFFLGALGLGILCASIDGRNAQKFAADCARKIENSYESTSVIEACKEEAKKREYQLEVNVFTNAYQQKYAQSQLTYQCKIPVIGLTQEKKICWDIR